MSNFIFARSIKFNKKNEMYFYRCVLALFLLSMNQMMVIGQEEDSTKIINELLDQLYIEEIENKNQSVKVLHAEPLYIDLIRDLGARKGEKEWNVGMGLIDRKKYDEYEALVEYEFAPIDRLGLEIELPFSFYYAPKDDTSSKAPSSRLNSIKLAAQYTFLVSEKAKTSLAIGYLHEFEITDFSSYTSSRFFTGNIYYPFFIAAKRWGNNFHTLIYTGPSIQQHFHDNSWETTLEIHTNFHYMIPGTRNFIGVEVNKEIYNGGMDIVLRPQMRVGLTDNIMIGIVTGIAIQKRDERFSSFLRLIYEPGHKVRHR